MKLEKLLRGIEVKSMNLVGRDTQVRGISSDSETIERGELFVCLKGTRHDGSDYIKAALEKRAAAVVIDSKEKVALNIPYIEVADTRRALAFLWDNYYENPAKTLKLIAVTGTNGKTTTTTLIHRILTEAGKRCALIGTLNGKMTTPDPHELYQRLSEFSRDGVEYVVMEASSHALALEKLSPLEFECGVFTNLTPEHLDFHSTMDEYAAAKSKLFSKCRISIINRDDEYSRIIARNSKNPPLFYSAANEDVEYFAANIAMKSVNGVEYALKWQNGRLNVTTPMPGVFAVYNTLAAASATLALGISPTSVANAIRTLDGVDGRLERVRTDKDFTVYIDYAHTPDALEKTLTLLRNLRDNAGKGRVIVLFGCGGDRDASKRPIMGQIASRLADLTIITSDNSRSEEPSEIIRRILKGVDRESRYKVIDNRREAIEYAITIAAPNDIVLLAGKGHERYEIDRDGRHPFDERECVAEALKKLDGKQ